MQNKDQHSDLKVKLNAYKKRYFSNILLKGSLISFAVIGAFFLIINYLEYSLYLSPIVKITLLFVFICILLFQLVFKIGIPLYHLFWKPNNLSDEEAAKQIGRFFPEINDKLLNIIQLQNLSAKDNALIQASINQKINQIRGFDWNLGINLKQNVKYAYYVLVLLVVSTLLSFISPNFFSDSTYRLVRFQEQFEKPLPFNVALINNNLNVFFNEDLTVKFSMTGNQMPEQLRLSDGSRKWIMRKLDGNTFEYTFRNVNSDFRFSVEAAGFVIGNYKVKTLRRPQLQNLRINITHPPYLKMENRAMENQGNISVPEGSIIQWKLSTEETDSLLFTIGKQTTTAHSSKNSFITSHEARVSTAYEIHLKNTHGENKDKISYSISVVKDEHPKVQTELLYDSTYFDRVIVGGQLQDDYGLRKLEIVYELNEQEKKQLINIQIEADKTRQSFYYDWDLSSLALKNGGTLKFFVRVWDNDGVNGSKYGTSQTYYLTIPDEKEISSVIEKSSKNIEDQLDKGSEKNKDLQKMLEDADFRIKSKRELNWQDKKLLQDIIEEKNSINEQLEKLKEEFKENIERREQFQKPNDQLKEKSKQLEELIDALQDEETKQLYEELQRLLNEKEKTDDFNQLMNQIKKQERNMNKDLERTKELFKRLQFELKLEKSIEDLEKLQKEQEEAIQLNEESEKANKEENNAAAKKQEEIQEQFDNINEQIEELEKLNKELSKPKRMEDTETERQDIQEQLQNIQQHMQEGADPQKSKKEQQKAKDQMKELQEKMGGMMSAMNMEMLNENIDDLRKILDNLLKLSFAQEELLQNFRAINESDPRFISLSQRQLKLEDDSRVIEDSLQALAGRVFQLQSFINKELSEMKDHMGASMHHLRERELNNALSKQQFAMTSMNNLALLLDDVLDQLQDMMADAMGMPQPGSGESKPNGMDMSEMQDMINRQIQELSEGQKSGREFSEELMRMADEQEMIRQMLKEKADQLEKEGGFGNGEISDLLKLMEESEKDLVNKRINPKLIKRQEQIKTRLLEAEKAIKEQDTEEERKGNTAIDYEKRLPKAMEEYIKSKQQEIELLKSVPPKLTPFYKEEVNKYFERLREQNKEIIQ